MSSTVSIWTKSPLSSFPTHQHRHASMERIRQAGQKWRREDPLVALTASPTGRDDPVDEIVGRPEAGVLDANGVHGAVRDNLLGKHELAEKDKSINGEHLSVDISDTAPVGADEGKRAVRRVAGEGVIRHSPPASRILLPGVQAPQKKVGNSEDVGGHGGLLSPRQSECCPRATRVRGISDTHETRSRLLSKIIIFASQDLISCLPTCQSALSDKDLLDLSMKADIYITYERVCQ